jgi:hypothetical protein
MAMTGARVVTTHLGLVEEVPPREIAKKKAPHLIRRLRPKHRKVAVELLHWAYGSVSGAAFGALPRQLRASRLAGPAYGVLIWLLFEAGVSPLLGLRTHERPVRERVALALDHALYGIVVARA